MAWSYDSFLIWIPTGVLPYFLAAICIATTLCSVSLNIWLLVTLKKKKLSKEPFGQFFVQFATVDFLACAAILIPTSVLAILSTYELQTYACYTQGVMSTLLYLNNFTILSFLITERWIKLRSAGLYRTLFQPKCKVVTLSVFIWIFNLGIAAIPFSEYVEISYDFYHSGCVVKYSESLFYLVGIFCVSIGLTFCIALCTYPCLFYTKTQEIRRLQNEQMKLKPIQEHGIKSLISNDNGSKDISKQANNGIMKGVNHPNFVEKQGSENSKTFSKNQTNGPGNKSMGNRFENAQKKFEYATETGKAVFVNDDDFDFKMAMTVFIICVIMGLSWLPYFIVAFYDSFHTSCWSGFYTISLLFALPTYCLKPLIYIAHHRNKNEKEESFADELSIRDSSAKKSWKRAFDKVDKMMFMSSKKTKNVSAKKRPKEGTYKRTSDENNQSKNLNKDTNSKRLNDVSKSNNSTTTKRKDGNENHAKQSRATNEKERRNSHSKVIAAGLISSRKTNEKRHNSDKKMSQSDEYVHYEEKSLNDMHQSNSHVKMIRVKSDDEISESSRKSQEFNENRQTENDSRNVKNPPKDKRLSSNSYSNKRQNHVGLVPVEDNFSSYKDNRRIREINISDSTTHDSEKLNSKTYQSHMNNDRQQRQNTKDTAKKAAVVKSLNSTEKDISNFNEHYPNGNGKTFSPRKTEETNTYSSNVSSSSYVENSSHGKSLRHKQISDHDYEHESSKPKHHKSKKEVRRNVHFDDSKINDYDEKSTNYDQPQHDNGRKDFPEYDEKLMILDEFSNNKNVTDGTMMKNGSNPYDKDYDGHVVNEALRKENQHANSKHEKKRITSKQQMDIPSDNTEQIHTGSKNMIPTDKRSNETYSNKQKDSIHKHNDINTKSTSEYSKDPRNSNSTRNNDKNEHSFSQHDDDGENRNINNHTENNNMKYNSDIKTDDKHGHNDNWGSPLPNKRIPNNRVEPKHMDYDDYDRTDYASHDKNHFSNQNRPHDTTRETMNDAQKLSQKVSNHKNPTTSYNDQQKSQSTNKSSSNSKDKQNINGNNKHSKYENKQEPSQDFNKRTDRPDDRPNITGGTSDSATTNQYQERQFFLPVASYNNKVKLPNQAKEGNMVKKHPSTDAWNAATEKQPSQQTNSSQEDQKPSPKYQPKSVDQLDDKHDKHKPSSKYPPMSADQLDDKYDKNKPSPKYPPMSVDKLYDKHDKDKPSSKYPPTTADQLEDKHDKHKPSSKNQQTYSDQSDDKHNKHKPPSKYPTTTADQLEDKGDKQKPLSKYEQTPAEQSEDKHDKHKPSSKFSTTSADRNQSGDTNDKHKPSSKYLQTPADHSDDKNDITKSAFNGRAPPINVQNLSSPGANMDEDNSALSKYNVGFLGKPFEEPVTPKQDKVKPDKKDIKSCDYSRISEVASSKNSYDSIHGNYNHFC